MIPPHDSPVLFAPTASLLPKTSFHQLSSVSAGAPPLQNLFLFINLAENSPLLLAGAAFCQGGEIVWLTPPTGLPGIRAGAR